MARNKYIISFLLLCGCMSLIPVFVMAQTLSTEILDPANDLYLYVDVLHNYNEDTDTHSLTQSDYSGENQNDVKSIRYYEQQKLEIEFYNTWKYIDGEYSSVIFLGNNLDYNGENYLAFGIFLANFTFRVYMDGDEIVLEYFKTILDVVPLGTGTITDNLISFSLNVSINFNSFVMFNINDNGEVIDLVVDKSNGFDIIGFLLDYWVYIVIGLASIIVIYIFINSARRKRMERPIPSYRP